jgi:hypothetical protein
MKSSDGAAASKACKKAIAILDRCGGAYSQKLSNTYLKIILSILVGATP